VKFPALISKRPGSPGAFFLFALGNKGVAVRLTRDTV